MKIWKIADHFYIPDDWNKQKPKTWPTSYAPEGGFPKLTRQTGFEVTIHMNVDEFLKLDEYYDTGKYGRLAREILLRIIRTHPDLIRAKTEGKI